MCKGRNFISHSTKLLAIFEVKIKDKMTGEVLRDVKNKGLYNEPISKKKSIETGRVEKGSSSNQ